MDAREMGTSRPASSISAAIDRLLLTFKTATPTFKTVKPHI